MVFFLFVLMACLVALPFHLFVEKPCIRLGRHLSTERAHQVEALWDVTSIFETHTCKSKQPYSFGNWTIMIIMLFLHLLVFLLFWQTWPWGKGSGRGKKTASLPSSSCRRRGSGSSSNAIMLSMILFHLRNLPWTRRLQIPMLCLVIHSWQDADAPAMLL